LPFRTEPEYQEQIDRRHLITVQYFIHILLLPLRSNSWLINRCVMLFAVASCDDVHFKVLGAWFFKTINLKSIKKASYVLYIVFIPGIFFLGGESPPKKPTIPHKRLPNCVL